MKLKSAKLHKIFCFFTPGKSISSFVVFVLLFLCIFGVCFAAEPINPSIEPKEKISLKPVTLRLVIKDFIMISGDRKFINLQNSLPELIALGLIENESVKYVTHEELLLEAARKYPSAALQKKRYTDLMFDSDILDEIGIDLIMTGNYFEYRGKIYIKAYLENRKGKEAAKPLPLKTSNRREIYPAIKQLANELNAAILSIAGKPLMQFAVFCFKDSSRNPSKAEKWREKDIPMAIISDLQEKSQIRVVPFSETETACQNETYKIPYNIDAVIRGTFSIEGDQIMISPALYVTKTKSTIQLASQKENISNYYVISDNLVKKISSVIDTIVEEGGKLNVEPLAFETDKPDQYVKKGNEYLERNNTKVAFMMFNKALEIDPDYEEGYYSLGMVRYRQREYKEALVEFNKALGIINKMREKKEKVDYRLEAKVYQGIGKTFLDLSNNYEEAIRPLLPSSPSPASPTLPPPRASPRDPPRGSSRSRGARRSFTSCPPGPTIPRHPRNSSSFPPRPTRSSARLGARKRARPSSTPSSRARRTAPLSWEAEPDHG